MLNFLKKIIPGLNKKGKVTTDSITYFNKGMGNEDKAELFRIQGAARRKKGDFHGSISKYQQALDIFKSAMIYTELALARFEAGDVKNSLLDIESAIKLDANNIDAYKARSFIKEKMGDINGSKQDLEIITKLTEKNLADNQKELNSPEEYIKRANKKIDTGDLDGSLSDFNKAIEFKPEEAEYYLNRGAVKQAKGDSIGANEDFSKAKELQTAQESYY